MKKHMKFLSLLLACTCALQIMPVTAFAADASEEQTVVIEAEAEEDVEKTVDEELIVEEEIPDSEPAEQIEEEASAEEEAYEEEIISEKSAAESEEDFEIAEYNLVNDDDAETEPEESETDAGIKELATDDWVAMIDGGQSYESLQEAIDAAENGDTIVLLCDVTPDTRLSISGKNITLDLGGYTLYGVFDVQNAANVTITNGNVYEGSSYSWVYASGDDSNPTKFVLASDASIIGDVYALCICGVTGASDYDGHGFVVEIDGTVQATAAESSGIWVQGNLRYTDASVCDLIINGTVIAGAGGAAAVNANGWCNVIINDGAVLEGATGIEIRSGSLTVNGGTITALANTFSNWSSSNGNTSEGGGIVIATHTTDNPITVTINDGVISGYYAFYEDNVQGVSGNNITINITGGQFIGSSNADCAIVVDDYGAISCTITGGDFIDASGEKFDIADYLDSDEYCQDDQGNVMEHQYDEGTITKEPTCVDEGEMTYTCTVCGKSYTEAVEATGEHDYVEEITKAPNCIEAGEAKYTCSVCGDSYTEVLPANGEHNYELNETINADCGNDGKNVYVCTVCGDSYEEKIPATGEHQYDDGVITKEPTCGEAGEITYTCTICGDTDEEIITATGDHQYDEGIVTKEPNCTDEGEMTYTCTVCGDSYTEALPTNDEHDYVETVITPASCEEDGESEFTCSRCEDSYTEVTEALGHDPYTVPAVDPTCTDTGLTEGRACSRCGETYVEQNVVPALGHDYSGEITTPATCTEKGVKTYTCSRCGDTYTEDIAPAGHHAVTDKTVAATCTQTGLTEGSHCDKCGIVLTAQKTTAKLGHNYKWVTDKKADYGIKGSRHQECSRCGAKGKTESIAAKKVGTLLPKISKNTKKSQTIKWNSIKGATKYKVYGTTCSGNNYELLKTTKKTFAKISGLKSGKYYKYYVVAYNGSTKIAKSYTIHGTTKGSSSYKYGNPTSISLKKSSISLKVGKSYKIKAAIKSSKTVKQHVNKIRYLSSDTSIAKVSDSGKITAVSKGSCKIYVIAQDGTRKTVKVTVK